VIGKTARDSVPAWPVPRKAPEGAPNVLLIVLDDTGFGQIGCFGGLGGRVETPHMDRLAAQGLRYNNFHTTALCSPTRAAVLTGRNHHTVGVASIMETATGYPGYNARIPKEAAMLPAVLTENGYNTMCLGKWHLAPDEHITASGPYDRWPLGQGFERFYGFLPGETSQWEPDLWHDNHKVDPPATPEEGYHLNVDLADKAIEWITAQKAVTPSKPFFMYYATGAMHSPHHAPKEYIERYKGRFDAGWDVVREETLKKQKELGIVPESTVLPPRNPGVRAWDELSGDEKRLFCRQMEVFAAYLTHTDEQIGRVLAFLERSGLMQDTLIVLLSDNGASGEGGFSGLASEMSYFNMSPETVEDMLAKIDAWGDPSTHPHYATGWAAAGNTPNRWYKQMVHEGGTRDPLIIHWPGHIKDAGAVRNQFHHAVDVTPTILDILGLEMPAVVRGWPQMPLEGKSLAYSLTDGDAPTPKKVQYFEMLGHRALWSDGWKLVTAHISTSFKFSFGVSEGEAHDEEFDHDTWELYHLDEDFSELNDLAAQHPDKVRDLLDLWWAEAGEHRVLPLDDTLPQRLLIPKPRVLEERDTYVYYSPVKLTRSGSPAMSNRSYTIAAEVEIPEGGAEGVIVSDGGVDGGLSLCIKDGTLYYVSNFLAREYSVITSSVPVPAGKVEVRLEFNKTTGSGGTARLFVNGKAAGEAEVARVNPVAFSPAEGLEVGSDSTSPVWPEYSPPFTFSGTINRVEIRSGDQPPSDPEAEAKMHDLRQ
jgi:arylsulfatase